MTANNSTTPTDQINQFTEEELMNEEWRPVVGFEQWYSVSNLGRLRRDARRTFKNGTILKRNIPKLLLINHVRQRYPLITLYPGPTTRTVHSIVCTAFLGPPPKGYECNHLDGHKENNRLSNLEYVTRGENCKHASVNGLLAFGDKNGSRKHPEKLPRGKNSFSAKHPERLSRGENHYRNNLTMDDIHSIIKYRLYGIKTITIASIFNVHQTTIQRILNGKHWSGKLGHH